MHRVAASKFRLGHSTTWNIINSPLYFFVAFRLNIILNSYVRCMLKFFRIRLVKWFLNIEVHYIKIGLIVFSSSKGSFSRIRKIKIKKKRTHPIFPIWNYTYIDQATYVTKLLAKYGSRGNHNRKAKWTLWIYDGAPKKRKAFPVVFYKLGKRRSKLKRKKAKWKRSLENIVTLNRDSSLVRKRDKFNSLKKFAKFPSLQLQGFLSFKIALIFSKFSSDLFFNKKKYLLKIKIFSFLVYLNLFIKQFSSSSKNKAILRLVDAFLGSDLKFKKGGHGIQKRYKFPRCNVFIDFFSYIKGLNDEFTATRGKFGEIVNIKAENLHKLNMPWASLFNTGLFMPYSLKRLARKNLINFEIKKIRYDDYYEVKKDKFSLINYLVKLFVFQKTSVNLSSKITTNTFFFNRKGLIKRLLFIKKLFKNDIRDQVNLNKNLKFYSKNWYHKIKLRNRLKIYKKFLKLPFSDFLLSGKIPYIWDNLSKYKRHSIKTLSLTSFIQQIRRPFNKKFSINKKYYYSYSLKIYKFFLIKYISLIIEKLIVQNYNNLKNNIGKDPVLLESKLKLDPDLISGSKNLEKYVNFFKSKIFFLNSLNNNLGLTSYENENTLDYKNICFFSLSNFISINYNHYYSKFLVRFIIKLIRFNILFYMYKKNLIKFKNNTNFFDVKSHMIFGKRHRYTTKFINKKDTINIEKKYKEKNIKNKSKNKKKEYTFAVVKEEKYTESNSFNLAFDYKYNYNFYLYLYVTLKLIYLRKLRNMNNWDLLFRGITEKNSNLKFLSHWLWKTYKINKKNKKIKKIDNNVLINTFKKIKNYLKNWKLNIILNTNELISSLKIIQIKVKFVILLIYTLKIKNKEYYRKKIFGLKKWLIYRKYFKFKEIKEKSIKEIKSAYYEPIPMPVVSSDPVYVSFPQKKVLRMLTKFYQRTSNSNVDRYELVRRFIRKQHTKIIGRRKIKYFKKYLKRETFSWAGEAFKPHVWKIKYTYPVEYKKPYFQILRLEEKPLLDKPKDEHYQISYNLNKKRRIYRNTLKIARNMGKLLLLRKAFLNYMFSINWAKPEVENQYIFMYDDVDWYSYNYFNFFLKSNRTKKPNYSLSQSFDKNVHNPNKLHFYKNKCLLGFNATQSIRFKWKLFNYHLKKKIKSDLQTFAFHEEGAFVKSNIIYNSIFELFSDLYYDSRANRSHLWKIKKKAFFNRLFWTRSRHRLVRRKTEQRKRKRMARKTKFRFCIKIKRDYKRFGVYPAALSELVWHDYEVHKGHKFAGVQLFASRKKYARNFENRFNYFYKYIHYLYPENWRKDIIPFIPNTRKKIALVSEDITDLGKSKLLRNISQFRYWLRFAKVLNIYKFWFNTSRFFKKNIYLKESISSKLFDLKKFKYHILQFYKVKYSLELENIFLKLLDYASFFLNSKASKKNISWFASIKDFEPFNYYLLNKLWFSSFKVLMLTHYINSLLCFNVNVIKHKSNLRLRQLDFYTEKFNINAEFKLVHALNLTKSTLFILSKLYKIKNEDKKILLESKDFSKYDLISSATSTPIFDFNSVTNKVRFVKFVVSKNIDFSLFNTLKYSKSLNRKDFIISLKYILANNLTKFFNSTKLEKNFIFISNLFKIYFLDLIKKIFLKKTYFILSSNFIFMKKINLKRLAFQVVLNYSINYFINLNINSWINYVVVSRNVNKFFKYWLTKKKFLFWITQEFEKDLRLKVSIYFINSISAFFASGKLNIKTPYNALFQLSLNEQKKWSAGIIYTDLTWASLIAMKYHCVSFLAENISKQLKKRKKHWAFLYSMKYLLTRDIPNFQFKKGIGHIYTIKVSINGKVNGRNRSINYIFLKKNKDEQKPRTHQNYLHVNYGFRESLSRYGVFAIKIWFIRI